MDTEGGVCEREAYKRAEDGEEEDEFVVIRESADGDVEKEGIIGQQRARYVEEESASISECGSNGVADVGEGFSVGVIKTPTNSIMNSSLTSFAGRQPQMLDSSYISSFYSFESAAKVDKLIESMQESRGEQEKYGTMLSQVHAILLSDLDKEKTNTSELHSKCKRYAEKLDASENNIRSLEEKMRKLKEESECNLAEMDQALKKLSLMVEDRDRQADQLKQHVGVLMVEKAQLHSALSECHQELEAKTKEVETQAEIIKVLNEESVENSRFFDESRKVYRQRLNDLEAQVASMYARNEGESPLAAASANPRTQRVVNYIASPTDNSSSKKIRRTSTDNSSGTIFICDRCLHAFPKNGVLVAHQMSKDSCRK